MTKTMLNLQQGEYAYIFHKNGSVSVCSHPDSDNPELDVDDRVRKYALTTMLAAEMKGDDDAVRGAEIGIMVLGMLTNPMLLRSMLAAMGIIEESALQIQNGASIN